MAQEHDWQYDLKNRYLHVGYNADSQSAIQSARSKISKCQNCTLDELAILRALSQDPYATQKELASIVGVSERSIKRKTVDLQNKGMLRRRNGKRSGQWEVLVEVETIAIYPDNNSN